MPFLPLLLGWSLYSVEAADDVAESFAVKGADYFLVAGVERSASPFVGQ
jgi:hypothetical protein